MSNNNKRKRVSLSPIPNGKEVVPDKKPVKQVKSKEDSKVIEVVAPVIEMLPITPEIIETIDERYYS